MMEAQENALNPFSREKAYLTFRENMKTASRLKEELSLEMADGSVDSERERLLKATEALGRLTDNSILRPIVQKALEERNSQ